MRHIAPVAALFSAVVLSACTGRPSLDRPALSTRSLNLEEFFQGQVVAYGQFQDRLGRVSRRFDVRMNGVWDGKVLTLTEDFTYEDGSTERRVWMLRKTGPDTWEGTAPGVIGTATGQEKGDTFNWRYTIDLPIGGGRTTRVGFDDWMWLLTDRRVLNRAWMQKYGVNVGEVTIFFEKR
ncbi:MAG: DUF3833 domain-containing protein [Pseudomonadota bacterium]